MRLGMGAGIRKGGKIPGGIKIYELVSTEVVPDGSVPSGTFYLETDLTPVLLTAFELNLRDNTSVIEMYYKLGLHSSTPADYTLFHTSDSIVPNDNRDIDQLVELPTPFELVASQQYSFWFKKPSGRFWLKNEANKTTVGELGLAITTDAGGTTTNPINYSGNSMSTRVYYQAK